MFIIEAHAIDAMSFAQNVSFLTIDAFILTQTGTDRAGSCARNAIPFIVIGVTIVGGTGGTQRPSGNKTQLP